MQTKLEIVVEIVGEIGVKAVVKILSYTRGQTLLASGSHVTYRISSPNII